jgi:hypothetical protein
MKSPGIWNLNVHIHQAPILNTSTKKGKDISVTGRGGPEGCEMSFEVTRHIYIYIYIYIDVFRSNQAFIYTVRSFEVTRHIYIHI